MEHVTEARRRFRRCQPGQVGYSWSDGKELQVRVAMGFRVRSGYSHSYCGIGMKEAAPRHVREDPGSESIGLKVGSGRSLSGVGWWAQASGSGLGSVSLTLELNIEAGGA